MDPHISDPEKRAEATRAAEKLVASASGAEGEAAADLLVKAAAIYESALADLQMASSLLRRALQEHPQCKAALARLRSIAEVRGDWSELADVLDLASRLPMSDEQRACLSAERGDILAKRLGRIAEARGLYREAARLSLDNQLKDAAHQAAERIESMLSERRPGGTVQWLAATEWTPVAKSPVEIESLKPGSGRPRPEPGLVAPERSTTGPAHRKAAAHHERSEREEARALADAGQVERAIELYKKGLEHEPIDELLLSEAIAFGATNGRLDIARFVLPGLEPKKRAELVADLAQAATVTGDEDAALLYRAAAFEDAPSVPANFQAAVQILRSKQDEEGLGRTLEKRLHAIEDNQERRAILFELATLREARGQVREAAEALLESIRTAGGEEEVTDALAAIDRLSVQARDRTLLTRAHGAAAARNGIAPEAKAQHMRELVRILGEELGDEDGAKAALAELDATPPKEQKPASPSREPDRGARPKATQPAEKARPESLRARPKLVIDPAADPFTALGARGRSMTVAPVSDSDWGQAVQLHSLDTIIDGALSAEERSRLLDTIHVEEQEVKAEDAVLEVGWTAPVEPLQGPPDDAPTPISAVDVVVVEEVDLPATRSRPSDVVLAALRRGDLEEALEVLAASVVSKNPEVEAGLWFKAGLLARELVRDDDAVACLDRAVELSRGEMSLAKEARRALAEVNAKKRAYRAAAHAITPLARPHNFEQPLAERGEDLLLLGRYEKLAGDRASAKTAFEEALRAGGAVSAAAAAELASILASNKDRDGIAALSIRVDALELGGELRAEWLIALAAAWGEISDPGAAKDALAEALAVDRASLKAAEASFLLGRNAAREAWVDEGLRELRARALEHGAASRAFAVAAVLVAREVADENDRTTYDSLRVALSSTPRAAQELDWIEAWLGAEEKESGRDAEVELGARIEALLPLAEAIESAAIALGLGRIDLFRLEAGPGPIAARPGREPALGLTEELERRPLKALRFEIARAAAALAVPRLLPALAEQPKEDEAPSPSVIALDRAGLVLSGDPAVALVAIGPRTRRGEALIDFAVSRELCEIWERFGLGVAPRATSAVAKESARD